MRFLNILSHLLIEIFAAIDFLRMENIVWLCPFSVAEWNSFRKITSTTFPSKTNLIFAGPRVELLKGMTMQDSFKFPNQNVKSLTLFLTLEVAEQSGLIVCSDQVEMLARLLNISSRVGLSSPVMVIDSIQPLKTNVRQEIYHLNNVYNVNNIYIYNNYHYYDSSRKVPCEWFGININ